LILDARTLAGKMQSAFFKKLLTLALFDYGLHKMMHKIKKIIFAARKYSHLSLLLYFAKDNDLR
jgi:hypothetical protein